MGMEKALELDLHHVFFLSDSLILSKLLNSSDTYNDIYGILCDIRNMSNHFSTISFGFVPRVSNVEADSLTKYVLRTLDSFHYLSFQ